MKKKLSALVTAVSAIAAASAAAVEGLPPSGSGEPVTRVLQAAIDSAAASGGGVVKVPAGEWVTGQLHLKSGVTLELGRGATLLGSTNMADYVRYEPRCSLIIAEGAENVGLRGPGTIDGRGGSFTRTGLRPHLVRFISCTNVVAEDVSLRAGAAWTIYCLRCDGVVYRRLRIWSHVNHCNDGMDIASRNVLVEDCDIDSDDDGLALKTPFPDVVVENVVVRNCRIASSCNSIHLGTESYGTMRNVDIHDCRIVPPSACRRFDWRKSALGATEAMIGLAGITVMCIDGAVMGDIRIRNLEMEGPTTPIFVRCDRRHAERPGVRSKLDGVLFENIRVKAASRVASSITGVGDIRPANIVVRGFDLVTPGGGTLEDCAMPVPECEGDSGHPTNLKFDRQCLPAHGFYVRHADGVRFEKVRTRTLERDDRPAIFIDDSDVTVDSGRGLTASAAGLGKTFTLTPEKRRELEASVWRSYRREGAYYREASVTDPASSPLAVVLGVSESDRALVSSVIGQGRRRGFSVLMPFARTVEGVVAAVRRVTAAGQRRKVYLKGDGPMASLALALMADHPALFSGASVIALSGKVPARLAGIRSGEADIVVAAGNPAQVRAGFEAFNALAAPKDRIDARDVDEIVRSGKVPARLLYRGPYDHDFPSPNRKLVFRRESGGVRLSVTSARGVTAFDPSFGWMSSRCRNLK